jgi:hypothetical protein
LIWATPLSMLQASHIEPWNNWAQLQYYDDKDTPSTAVLTLNFYFAWTNPIDQPVVINCETDLIPNGLCYAEAWQGLLDPGGSSLEFWLHLNAFVGDTEIHSPQLIGQFGCVAAQAGHGFFRGNDYEVKSVSGIFNSACKNISINPHQLVVFEVAVVVLYVIAGAGGDISFDFYSYPGAEILCPAVTVDLFQQIGTHP